jgi:hypothetical protein
MVKLESARLSRGFQELAHGAEKAHLNRLGAQGIRLKALQIQKQGGKEMPNAKLAGYALKNNTESFFEGRAAVMDNAGRRLVRLRETGEETLPLPGIKAGSDVDMDDPAIGGIDRDKQVGGALLDPQELTADFEIGGFVHGYNLTSQAQANVKAMQNLCKI